MNSELTVREIMDREFVGVSEPDGLVETVELLLEEDKETAVVLRGSEYVGVVTERDVLSLLVGDDDPADATVGDAMTERVPTVSPEESLSEAEDRLSTQSARRLVVTNGREPLGVVTEEDLLAGRSYATERTGAATSETGIGTEAETTTAAAEATGGLAESSGQSFDEQTAQGFEDQGICEVCGSLTRDLASFNGQLLCAECRDM